MDFKIRQKEQNRGWLALVFIKERILDFNSLRNLKPTFLKTLTMLVVKKTQELIHYYFCLSFVLLGCLEVK